MDHARSVPARRLWLLAVLLSAGCLGTPQGVTPVSGFELERYLGTWYEIARLDHRFERGLTHVTATYQPREGGGIAVLNRGYDPDAGAWREADGKALFVGEPERGALKVSFFGPFYGAYNIIALDRDAYEYAMVCGPNRSYLWILARDPKLPDAIIEELVTQAAALGFATEELIFVDHGRLPERDVSKA
jgi:apolipoprotein D and lipocalin family protein